MQTLLDVDGAGGVRTLKPLFVFPSTMRGSSKRCDMPIGRKMVRLQEELNEEEGEQE